MSPPSHTLITCQQSNEKFAQDVDSQNPDPFRRPPCQSLFARQSPYPKLQSDQPVNCSILSAQWSGRDGVKSALTEGTLRIDLFARPSLFKRH